MSKMKRAISQIHEVSEDAVVDRLRDLDAKTAPKPVHPVDRDLAAARPPAATKPGKGTTVHLTTAAAKELKKLAADRETTVHALMIEGVNLVFKQYGLPQIAEAGARPKPASK